MNQAAEAASLVTASRFHHPGNVSNEE